MVYNWRMHDNS